MMDDSELVRQARTCIYGTKQTDALLVEMADRIDALRARVAELEAALKKIATGTAPEADPDTGELIECWMDADEMREIAIRALDASRAADLADRVKGGEL